MKDKNPESTKHVLVVSGLSHTKHLEDTVPIGLRAPSASTTWSVEMMPAKSLDAMLTEQLWWLMSNRKNYDVPMNVSLIRF